MHASCTLRNERLDDLTVMGKGGKELGASSARTAVDMIHSDPRFRAFLEDNFDASSFASRALAETHTTADQQTEFLQQGIQLLDSQLRSEVASRQDELISQASKLQETETSLQRITLSVRSLQSVAARVRAEVSDPYKQILSKSVQLQNLQRTVDLLRHAIHRIKLVQKLRTQMGIENAGELDGEPAPSKSPSETLPLAVVQPSTRSVAASSRQHLSSVQFRCCAMLPTVGAAP